MIRFAGNPILKPIRSHKWESRYVFNPATIMLDGRFHIFYRAMGEDMISRIGYASSEDCYHIDERLPYPVFEPVTSLEKFGCEDPRLSIIEDECVMTYTAYGDIYQIAITTIPVEYILEKKWEWGERIFPFPNVKNKNAVLFPRKIDRQYVMLHRLEPDIHIAFSDDLSKWKCSEKVMSPRLDYWDSMKIGSASPPIELDLGWLLIYHGVDDRRVYRLGTAILDKENLGRVIYRAEKPILEPEADYERFGLVPNVVFSCGSVLTGDKLVVTYGGADTVVGVATFSVKDIISEICR